MAPEEMNRNRISVDDFAGLDLRVGTVVEWRRLAAVPGVSRVTVRLQERIESLAPSSALPPDLSGCRVVVASGLHPLHVGDESYTACLLTDGDAGEPRALIIETAAPDGSRLY